MTSPTKTNQDLIRRGRQNHPIVRTKNNIIGGEKMIKYVTTNRVLIDRQVNGEAGRCVYGVVKVDLDPAWFGLVWISFVFC